MDYIMSASTLVGVFLAVIVIIVGAPLLTIWSLNTLFALAIPYTVTTWFATGWLTLILAGRTVNTANTKNK